LKRLLTTEELADYIGLKPQTVRNKLSNGTFPIKPKKMGRKNLWEIDKVNEYIDKIKS
jgi:excisionase family DNA binding protein